MSDTVLVSVADGIARLTLNRPASLNAMDFEMAEAWQRAVAEATGTRGVRAIILDAVGPAFCAGGDILAMAEPGVTAADLTRLAGVISEGIRTLVEASVPSVAAVNGAVAGGGLGVMLAADYIVAADTAKFVGAYAGAGLTPDLGVSTLLPAAVGQRRALELLLQDRRLRADEAQQWGLVAEVVPAGEVAERALAIAQFWGDGAAAAYGQAVRLVRAGARSFADSLDDESRTIGAAFETPDAQARIAAFAAASAKSKRTTP